MGGVYRRTTRGNGWENDLIEKEYEINEGEIGDTIILRLGFYKVLKDLNSRKVPGVVRNPIEFLRRVEDTL